MAQQLTYHVRMEQPSRHYFQVELVVEGITDEIIELKLPVWTPGSYLVREYARHIENLHAVNQNGEVLPVQKRSKNTWSVMNNGNTIKVTYQVYAFEESVRTCLLDDEHASIAPAALFLYVENYDLPLAIHFYPPSGWKQISTSLPMIGNDPWKRIAVNRDILYDSPVEIGNQAIYTFHAAGIQHELAVYGPGNYSIEKLLHDIPKIVEEEVKIFEHHPCTSYLFILLNSNSMRGGLEHLDSTSLIFKRLNYEPENNYLEFLSLVSHEYFHLWNVKRLRPIALGPFNYDAENYTTSLWIAEGFTSYYDDLILRRCGIMNERTYLDIVEKNLNDAINPPGNAVHPVADASFDAWIKYYRQNENSPNAQVNYYVKGGVLAMLLDILIIHHSNGAHNLDHVMRDAYQKFYLDQNRGYTEEEFKSILQTYAGQDLTWFYNDHVFGTKTPDIKQYFGRIGVTITDPLAGTTETDLGISINDRNMITQVRKNSSGENSGLNVNDEIIAINNFRYTANLLPTIMTGKNTGDQVSFLVSRNGLIKTLEVTIQNTDKVNYKLSLQHDADDATKALYRKWIAV